MEKVQCEDPDQDRLPVEELIGKALAARKMRTHLIPTFR